MVRIFGLSSPPAMGLRNVSRQAPNREGSRRPLGFPPPGLLVPAQARQDHRGEVELPAHELYGGVPAHPSGRAMHEGMVGHSTFGFAWAGFVLRIGPSSTGGFPTKSTWQRRSHGEKGISLQTQAHRRVPILSMENEDLRQVLAKMK